MLDSRFVSILRSGVPGGSSKAVHYFVHHPLRSEIHHSCLTMFNGLQRCWLCSLHDRSAASVSWQGPRWRPAGGCETAALHDRSAASVSWKGPCWRPAGGCETAALHDHIAAGVSCKGRAGDQQAAVNRQRFMTTSPPASVARATLASSRRLIAPSSAQ